MAGHNLVALRERTYSFHGRVGQVRECQQIACLIVEFAHTMDLRVIAKGIETGAQIDELRTSSCEAGHS